MISFRRAETPPQAPQYATRVTVDDHEEAAADPAGRVAVITGAGSGIGFEIARQAALRGMAVVLADVEKAALDDAVRALRKIAPRVTGVLTDVSDVKSVENLAGAARQFGDPWLVVNNAGVGLHGRISDLRLADWEWVLGVNLWGVVNGVHTFLPAMIERDAGHLVNVSSMAGLVVAPRTGAPYAASKHAVVGLSEALYRELAAAGSQVGVSVVCPGPVRTRLGDASRNRPARLGRPPSVDYAPHETEELPHLMSAAEAGAYIMDRVLRRQFWVLPQASAFAAEIVCRGAQIAREQNPDDSSADSVLLSIDRPTL